MQDSFLPLQSSQKGFTEDAGSKIAEPQQTYMPAITNEPPAALNENAVSARQAALRCQRASCPEAYYAQKQSGREAVIEASPRPETHALPSEELDLAAVEPLPLGGHHHNPHSWRPRRNTLPCSEIQSHHARTSTHSLSLQSSTLSSFLYLLIKRAWFTKV